MTDTRLMHTVGVRALEWLWAHRDGFRLEPDVDPEVGFLERFKPVGELALICRVLFREGVAGSRQAELARQLLDHTWRHTLDGGRMLVRGQRIEPLSPIPFEVYLPYKELGYSQPEVERATVLYHRLNSWASLELNPTRRLGLSAFQRRFGLTPRTPEADLVGETWLARTPEPWTVSGHIAYDLTHTVFHLTDWGERPGRPAAGHRRLPRHLAAGLDRRLAGPGALGPARRTPRRRRLSAPPHPRRTGLGGLRRRSAARRCHARRARPCPRATPEEVFDIVYHPTLVAAFASVLATSRALTELAHAPS